MYKFEVVAPLLSTLGVRQDCSASCLLPCLLLGTCVPVPVAQMFLELEAPELPEVQ